MSSETAVYINDKMISDMGVDGQYYTILVSLARGVPVENISRSLCISEQGAHNMIRTLVKVFDVEDAQALIDRVTMRPPDPVLVDDPSQPRARMDAPPTHTRHLRTVHVGEDGLTRWNPIKEK